MKFENYVFYGACDDNDMSYIYAEEPEKYKGTWVAEDEILLMQANLFPKDRPVKLKLVKCEEE